MLNKVILMGRLTRDPELKTIGENNSVVNFSIAVDRPRYKDKEKETDFFNIVAWRKTADHVSKYFRKGKQVYVVGRLQTRTWDAPDGKRYITEIIAEEVGFADTKKDASANTENNGYDFADTSNIPDHYDVFGEQNY